MALKKPTWIENGTKTQGMINRTLVLWELQRQGKLELNHGTKQQLAELFGVGRPSVDRALAALAEAQDEVDQFLRKLDPTYLQRQTELSKRSRALFAKRHIQGTFLDEDEYKQELNTTGLNA